MTRWQVFGGRYDGLRINTTRDDETELTRHAQLLNQPRLTAHDIDNAGTTITITLTKEQKP